MVHYFEPPIDTRRAKRKCTAETSDDLPNHEDHETNPVDEETEEETEELNIPPNFPAAPLSRERERHAGERHVIAKEQRNIKRQHFIVLNTILHKCLLDQDFLRAGRAFGLLLRLEMAGRRVNLRQKGIWGIGAEILLNRPFKENDGSDPSRFQDDSVDDNDVDEIVFTDEGFQAARAYYDRLILQYPYRKTRPQDVSSQHFYPAMFGLWILQTQTSSQRALTQAKQTRTSQTPEPSANSSPSHTPSDTSTTNHQQTTIIKSHELAQARAIAARLDEVTFLPPFDQDAQLLKLRGMVELWMADLTAAVDPDGQQEAESQRLSAREHLRRAKAHGWKVTGSLSQLVEEDGGALSE